MSENEISRAAVKIVFRRKMEFHVTNTFLQTFILVCVGYMSLYFDVDNFTDRIMVTLTTMLVVATIMTSIQSVYRIMFTVWHSDFYCQYKSIFIFFIIVYHTFSVTKKECSKFSNKKF